VPLARNESASKTPHRLCRDAILEHVPVNVAERYERKLKRVRQQLRRELRERVL
jgi:hypothetical protein